jgi:hypothetical protein
MMEKEKGFWWFIESGQFTALCVVIVVLILACYGGWKLLGG